MPLPVLYARQVLFPTRQLPGHQSPKLRNLLPLSPIRRPIPVRDRLPIPLLVPGKTSKGRHYYYNARGKKVKGKVKIGSRYYFFLTKMEFNATAGKKSKIITTFPYQHRNHRRIHADLHHYKWYRP